MSEKRIREWAGSGGGTIVLCNPDDACADCQELYGALAADPDVVAVLLLLRALPEEIQSALTTDDRILIGVLCNVISRKFGFCLTDKGWEWTDE